MAVRDVLRISRTAMEFSPWLYNNAALA